MEPVVSIICNTYNQAGYIRDALDGFLMQKADFSFEALIHDDASTDGTADIIREYADRYPDVIKPFYQTENKYSKGVNINMVYQFPRVRGKYIAFCEGDDYWTDPLKLQKQVDAMESHSDVDICAACTAETQNERPCGKCAPADFDTVFTAEQVILGGGGFVATCSLMIRSEIFEHIPEFRKILQIDYTTQIMGALRGGMLYLADCMSVYRRFSKGSWSAAYYYNREMQISLNNKMKSMLLKLDEETEGKYSGAIQYKLKENEFYLLNNNGDYGAMLSSEYKEIYNNLHWKGKLKLRLRRCFPWLVSLHRKRHKKNFDKER